MRKNATVRRWGVALASLGVLAPVVLAQVPTALSLAQGHSFLWRHVGNAAVSLDLAGLATGPVDRVWYADGGNRLLIRVSSGRVFQTTDFERWQTAVAGTAMPMGMNDSAAMLPETGAQVRRPFGQTPRVYAFGRFVYRSDDGGRHWENTTAHQGASIIGDGLRDLAVSPSEEDEITVAGSAGVFRSLDGGRSWHGLNDSLPNLPPAKLRAIPTGGGGIQIELPGGMAAGTPQGGLILNWQPGERLAWQPGQNGEAATEALLRSYLAELLGSSVTSAATQGNYLYAGTASGRIGASADGAKNWAHSQITLARGAAVQAFWVDRTDPRIAIAVVGSRPGTRMGVIPEITGTRIVRTYDGGLQWDDLTSNLPGTSVNGVTVDQSAPVYAGDPNNRAVYIATDRGVYWSRISLSMLGAAPQWLPVPGLPEARVSDVRLDSEGVQLWAQLEGYGLFASLAPHRRDDPRVVSTADLITRAAAPGALLTIAGARVNTITAGAGPGGRLAVPVLDTTDAASQIQVPFESTGSTLSLSAYTAKGLTSFAPLPLFPTSPAISIDPDGTPLLLDADRGILLDGSNPIRSHMRVQILATGLGRVRPDWPAGTPGPLEDSPEVVAEVAAYLDREPLVVKRAIYAPGHIGLYLVEVEIPVLLQQGAAELRIEAGGQTSNPVRVLVVRDDY